MVRKQEKLNSDLYQWVSAMILMRARACVITQLTGISNLEARTMYKNITGKSSPPGQLPTNIDWFLENTNRRSHSALLLGLYADSVKVMEPYSAYTHAFYHYARITGPFSDRRSWKFSNDPAYRDSEDDYVIPFTRGHLLITSYFNSAPGARKCEIVRKRCRRCWGQFIGHQLELSNVCQICSRQKTAVVTTRAFA